ncbi:putative membrane associated eicosanoid/glutathione metabolism-like domain superfamily [Helianthus annuus]|uniref:Membrane associated eicosanoid/glutathione metabolism-like domain superfamily n=1 Tax=Helianthus annuus TaxID=4232 RepID=A0A251TBP6_HELAN|nr:putative membrane associated eicosanoid/glutathione metabolism-like domain superfamily [Helianthus annuus]
MVVGGLKHPVICDGLGLGYTIARFFYFIGCSSGDPKGQLPIRGNICSLLESSNRSYLIINNYTN